MASLIDMLTGGDEFALEREEAEYPKAHDEIDSILEWDDAQMGMSQEDLMNLVTGTIPGVGAAGLISKGGRAIPWKKLLEKVGLKSGPLKLSGEHYRNMENIANIVMKGKIKGGEMIPSQPFRKGMIGKPKSKTIGIIDELGNIVNKQGEIIKRNRNLPIDKDSWKNKGLWSKVDDRKLPSKSKPGVPREFVERPGIRKDGHIEAGMKEYLKESRPEISPLIPLLLLSITNRDELRKDFSTKDWETAPENFFPESILSEDEIKQGWRLSGMDNVYKAIEDMQFQSLSDSIQNLYKPEVSPPQSLEDSLINMLQDTIKTKKEKRKIKRQLRKLRRKNRKD